MRIPHVRFPQTPSPLLNESPTRSGSAQPRATTRARAPDPVGAKLCPPRAPRQRPTRAPFEALALARPLPKPTAAPTTAATIQRRSIVCAISAFSLSRLGGAGGEDETGSGPEVLEVEVHEARAARIVKAILRTGEI